MALLVVSVVYYVATFSFSGLLFHCFTPYGHDCGLHLFFIVFTLILVFAFAIVALHPKLNTAPGFTDSKSEFYNYGRSMVACCLHQLSLSTVPTCAIVGFPVSQGITNAMGFTITQKLCQLVALHWDCSQPSFPWSILLFVFALLLLCSQYQAHHVLVPTIHCSPSARQMRKKIRRMCQGQRHSYFFVRLPLPHIFTVNINRSCCVNISVFIDI